MLGTDSAKTQRWEQSQEKHKGADCVWETDPESLRRQRGWSTSHGCWDKLCGFACGKVTTGCKEQRGSGIETPSSDISRWVLSSVTTKTLPPPVPSAGWSCPVSASPLPSHSVPRAPYERMPNASGLDHPDDQSVTQVCCMSQVLPLFASGVPDVTKTQAGPCQAQGQSVFPFGA